MKTKLTKKEIKFLDMLCERVEKRIEENNKRFLKALYGLYNLSPPKLTDYSAIPFEMLKSDLVGNERSFKRVQDLFATTELVAGAFLAVRIVLAKGTIIIIYFHNFAKDIVLSVFQNGKVWTYKRYTSQHQLELELSKRKKHEHKFPFSRMFFSRPASKLTPAITKEEYGGFYLGLFSSVAIDREKELLGDIIRNQNVPEILRNSAYNPQTKRLYVVDAN